MNSASSVAIRADLRVNLLRRSSFAHDAALEGRIEIFGCIDMNETADARIFVRRVIDFADILRLSQRRANSYAPLYAAIVLCGKASAQSESITWHRLSLKTLRLLLAHLLCCLVYALISTLLICLEIKDRRWHA